MNYLIALGLLLGSLIANVGYATEVTGIEYRVQNGSIELDLWEKVQGNPSGKPVLVLAHGSATSGRESFDLQVPGFDDISLMDVLARAGFDVFAPSVRGFGRSTHPAAHLTTVQASEDLNAAVDHVRKLRGVNRVGLLSWSYGTQYGGMFVMAHPDKVTRWVSFAQMHLNSPDLARRRQKIDFYRQEPYSVIPEQAWKGRFTSLAPMSVNYPEVMDAFAKAAVKAEAKTPNGPQLDMVTIMPMVNPRLIKVPVMLIHGEYDDVADAIGLWPFFQELPNPDKRYVIVPEAGHMMQFQKGRGRFQQAVIEFFKADGER
jgi:pimeloyl-ACP methyl ester carboxylesterase